MDETTASETSRLLLRLLGAAYDDAAKAGLPARNPDLWGEVWAVASRPWVTPSEEFAGWLNEGPKLAAAAGCFVGIKVTEAKTAAPPSPTPKGRMDE